MRKFLLASVATLGTGGLMGAAFAQVPPTFAGFATINPIGSVSVKITSRAPQHASFSDAEPERMPCVAATITSDGDAAASSVWRRKRVGSARKSLRTSARIPDSRSGWRLARLARSRSSAPH